MRLLSVELQYSKAIFETTILFSCKLMCSDSHLSILNDILEKIVYCIDCKNMHIYEIHEI